MQTLLNSQQRQVQKVESATRSALPKSFAYWGEHGKSIRKVWKPIKRKNWKTFDCVVVSAFPYLIKQCSKYYKDTGDKLANLYSQETIELLDNLLLSILKRLG